MDLEEPIIKKFWIIKESHLLLKDLIYLIFQTIFKTYEPIIIGYISEIYPNYRLVDVQDIKHPDFLRIIKHYQETLNGFYFSPGQILTKNTHLKQYYYSCYAQYYNVGTTTQRFSPSLYCRDINKKGYERTYPGQRAKLEGFNGHSIIDYNSLELLPACGNTIHGFFIPIWNNIFCQN